jgi:hypothetical protein
MFSSQILKLESRNPKSKSLFKLPCCKNPKPPHKPDDCLEGNEKERKEWDREHGKKWIPYKKYKEQDKKSKSKDDEHNDNDHFGLPAMSASHLFDASTRKTDRWLPDTGATAHITWDKTNFIEYTAMNGLGTVNGSVRPKGMSTVRLRALLSDGSIKTITLYDCLYMPTCPVNLFPAYKLLKAGGYMKDHMLWTKDDKEIAQLDQKLHIIEADDNNEVDSLLGSPQQSDNPTAVAYPAALSRAGPDIELWHRRLSHLSFEGIQTTKDIVRGLVFKEKEDPPNNVNIINSIPSKRPNIKTSITNPTRITIRSSGFIISPRS